MRFIGLISIDKFRLVDSVTHPKRINYCERIESHIFYHRAWVSWLKAGVRRTWWDEIGWDGFDRAPAERVWSSIHDCYHCCQLKNWHQPQQKATVTLHCLMGCEWEPHSVMCVRVPVVEILHARTDSALMLPLTRRDVMRWREKDLTSSPSYTSVIHTHAQRFSLSHCGCKVIFCSQSLFVVSLSLKGGGFIHFSFYKHNFLQ